MLLRKVSKKMSCGLAENVTEIAEITRPRQTTQKKKQRRMFARTRTSLPANIAEAVLKTKNGKHTSQLQYDKTKIKKCTDDKKPKRNLDTFSSFLLLSLVVPNLTLLGSSRTRTVCFLSLVFAKKSGTLPENERNPTPHAYMRCAHSQRAQKVFTVQDIMLVFMQKWGHVKKVYHKMLVLYRTRQSESRSLFSYETLR